MTLAFLPLLWWQNYSSFLIPMRQNITHQYFLISKHNINLNRMKKASQSAIQSLHNISPSKQAGRLRKANTLIGTETIISEQDENQKTSRKEKTDLLTKSIEIQIRKAKEICQLAKQKSNICKTNRKNYETPAIDLPDLPLNHKLKDQNQYTRKLGSLQQHTPQDEVRQSIEKETPKTDCSFSMEKCQKIQKDDKKLQSLHEVRLIESFIADEEEQAEMSFVEQRGTGILDWQICLGKASEFKILKFINNEKYGKVYLAQSHRNNMIYSIKSIYRSVMDQNSVHKIVKEVEIQSYLNHPNIVKLYNFFVDDDSAYLVMEPCIGKNLYETLRDVGRVPEKTVIEWTKQILNAVQYIHKNGVLHRNLKLQNILLHENMIKICDFGSSIHINLLKETQDGNQPINAPLDSKVDIWSIGILIYELLYGIIPQEVSTKGCMMKIVQFNVNFSKDVSVSQSAKDFIMNCLQKNPRERSTIRELMDHQFLNQIDRFRWTIV